MILFNVKVMSGLLWNFINFSKDLKIWLSTNKTTAGGFLVFNFIPLTVGKIVFCVENIENIYLNKAESCFQTWASISLSALYSLLILTDSATPGKPGPVLLQNKTEIEKNLAWNLQEMKIQREMNNKSHLNFMILSCKSQRQTKSKTFGILFSYFV